MLRIARPPGQQVRRPRPAILILPGSAPPDPAWPVERLATGLARLGYVAVVPHRGEGVPASGDEEARQALRCLHARAPACGIDPRAVAALGWEDGGAVAVRLATMSPDREMACVLEFAGPLAPELLGLPASTRGAPLGPNPDVEGASARTSFFLACGTGDPEPLPAQYAAAARCLERLGAEAQVCVVKGDRAFPLEREYWKGSLDRGIEFLAQHLPAPPAP